ncbi:hypothetical protein BDN71DRAFT_301267 [Pleurotus eryngii]|uniref:Uncharacterized protein n=1 Tax=Pleurotus eryngii TaxID=5323 RepID=A0A9P5ZJM8_PLEER|nr:hypothetical protein BDN71DRAFT_301267 [Pleurotus eryngii]
MSRSPSPSTQTPTESPTDMHPDLSFEVIGDLEAMDIYGEEGDDDLDFDLDALNLAYPDEGTPSPLLPLPPATTNIDSTINTGVTSSCNKEILIAFEDPGDEAENDEDWGEAELPFKNASFVIRSHLRPRQHQPLEAETQRQCVLQAQTRHRTARTELSSTTGTGIYDREYDIRKVVSVGAVECGNLPEAMCQQSSQQRTW